MLENEFSQVSRESGLEGGMAEEGNVEGVVVRWNGQGLVVESRPEGTDG